MSKGILVLLGKQACLPEDPLTAAKQLGLRTTVLGAGCAQPSDLVDRHHQVSLRDPSATVALACKLHAQEPFNGVLTYDDESVPIAARIAERLGLVGQPVDSADAARDKLLMKQRFERGGVPIAAYTLAHGPGNAIEWATEHGYPVVVKPVRGSASQGVIRADNSDQLAAAYRRVNGIVRQTDTLAGGRPDTDLLVEEYLDGQEFSVELLIQAGAPSVLCTFEKPLPLCGPFFEESLYISPPRIAQRQRLSIEALARQAVQALGLETGAAHCEVRLTPDGPVVLEVAARLIGGACSRIFRDVLGADIHPKLIHLALGETVSIPREREVAAGAMMLPVPAEGRITEVSGTHEARQVDGIRDVIITVSPGDVLIPFPEQSCYIGFVTATGATPAAVQESLLSASALIDFDLRPLAAR